MPQRVIHAWMIVVGIAGLLLAAALVLYGADLRRASRTGPRWKRRLLTAALGLLSGLSAGLASRGLARSASAAPAAVSPEPAAEPAKAPASLAETPQWKRLTATWKEADDVASGRKGLYPFDAKGKKALLAALGARAQDIDALAAKDLLTAPEAGLLKKELDRLAKGVQAKRPIEMKMATCYEPMWMYTAADDALRRIADRLGLLGKLAAAPAIRPQVAAKVLATLQADLATGQNAEYLRYLKDQAAKLDDPKTNKYARKFITAAHRRDAEKNLQAARALAARLQARLSGRAPAPSLEKTAQWQTILEAWRFCKPLADTGKSTMAQRQQADQKINAIKQAVVELVNGGVLAPAEGGLLVDEADRVRTEIYRLMPTDFRGTCYGVPFRLSPAAASLGRLEKRLPLLQKLGRSGKVSPAVIEKVLPSVRSDLATLADPKQTRHLAPDRKAKVERTIAQAHAAAAKIQSLLEAAR